jgi:hypothetical protein
MHLSYDMTGGPQCPLSGESAHMFAGGEAHAPGLHPPGRTDTKLNPRPEPTSVKHRLSLPAVQRADHEE